MPMFFFNIAVGDAMIADPEGTDLPSLDDARLAAIDDARTLMSAAIMIGRDISSRSVKITDEAGKALLTVPFADAFKPTD